MPRVCCSSPSWGRRPVQQALPDLEHDTTLRLQDLPPELIQADRVCKGSGAEQCPTGKGLAIHLPASTVTVTHQWVAGWGPEPRREKGSAAATVEGREADGARA